MITKQLKVLIIAYECSPTRSHAPGSAWQVISRIAIWHKIWVVTEASQYQNEIEEYLLANPAICKNIHFKFISRTWEGYRKPRPIIPIRSMRDYKRWLKRAYEIVKILNKQIKFDIIHHLRANTVREPGYCWQLPIPYIWGPTGGLTRIPWRMLKLINWQDVIMQIIRNVTTDIQFRYKPRLRNAVKKATCVIAQTSFDKNKFKKVYGIETPILHEQASNPVNYRIKKVNNEMPIKIVWAGRCISLKGLPILLHAIADHEIKDKVIFHIAGDGPFKKKWQMLAKNLGIAKCCIWHGWISHQDTITLMQQNDVFAFPSLLEATSTAVMEALSTGLPVICMKHCGFGDVVDETCGITFDAINVKAAIKGFNNALKEVVQNPEMLERLSKGAINKAKEYSWDNLAETISKIYLDSLVKYFKKS